MLPAGDRTCRNKADLLLTVELGSACGSPCFSTLLQVPLRVVANTLKFWQIERHFHSHLKALALNQRPRINGARPLKQRIGQPARNSAVLTGCAAMFG